VFRLKGKMKAVLKHQRGLGAKLEIVDILQIKDHEVLVKVNETSNCGTDVHIYTWK